MDEIENINYYLTTYNFKITIYTKRGHLVLRKETLYSTINYLPGKEVIRITISSDIFGKFDEDITVSFLNHLVEKFPRKSHEYVNYQSNFY